MISDALRRRFLDQSPSDKFRTLIDTKDEEYLFVLLSKYSKKSVEELKGELSITMNVVKQRVSIKGSYESIYDIFTVLQNNAVQIFSITSNVLVIDLSQLMTKLR